MKALALLECLNNEPYSLCIELEDLGTEGSLLKVCDAVLSTLVAKSRRQSGNASGIHQDESIDSITLLSALGFKGINGAKNQESFRRGDRSIVLSALEYIVEQPAELVQNRCYLAKYLLPLALPVELSGDNNANTVALLKRYHQLQTQFKNVHRQYSALRKEATASAELGEEIEQLETERAQLANRIDDLQNEARGRGDLRSFGQIFHATSTMRLLQEEASRQQRKLEETSELFEAISQTFADTEERLNVLERCMLSSAGEEPPTVQSILEYLARDVQDCFTNVRSDLALSHHLARERLDELSSESQPTDEAVLALTNEVNRLEEDCKVLRRGTGGADVSGVDVFVTYNNEAARTLAARKTVLETKRKEFLKIQAVTNELENEASATRKIKDVKQKAERSSQNGTEELCRDDTGVADEAVLSKLKEMRAELLDMEDEHKAKRERYERLSIRFATDRQSLEDDVDRLEKEWMTVNSTQKELQQSKNKMDVALKKLNDFDATAAMYEKELAQQDSMLHQLQKKKHNIEEQYTCGSKQRDLFNKVERLLQTTLSDPGR